MIVDTSVLLAMLLREPEAATFRTVIADTPDSRISAGSAIELQAVLTRRFKGVLDEEADDLVAGLKLAIVPVTPEQAIIGRDAYRVYGIGSGHPARLNYGDCFAYALSKASGEPLLFKGDDFIHTDVARVAARPAA